MFPMLHGLVSQGGATTLLQGLSWWFDFDEPSDGSGSVARLDSVAGESLTDNNTIASATDGSDTVASIVRANSEYFSHANGAKWQAGNNEFTFVGWLKPTTLNVNAGYVAKTNEFVFNQSGTDPNFILYNGSGTIRAQVAAGAGLTNLATGAWYPFRFGYDKTRTRAFWQIGTGGLYYEKDTTGAPGTNTNAMFIGAFITQYYNGLAKNFAKYDRLLTWGEWVQFCSGVVYPFAGVPAPSTDPRWALATEGRANLTNFSASVTGGYSKIILVGDSWMDLDDIPARFRSSLQTTYGDGGGGYWTFCNSLGNQDARVTSVSRTGTWTETSNTGHGIEASHVTATAAAAINFTGTFDAITIHYRQVSGGGDFRYRVDAGGWTTVNTAGATAYGTSTISGLANSSHAVNVEWVSGTVVVFGAYMTSGSTGIVVNRCGHTGMTTGNLAGVDGTNWTAAATSLDPDLAIITLGTNDQTTNVTPATYISNMATIIGRLPAGCDVVVAMPADTIRRWSASGATTYSIYDYAEAMYAAGGWDAFHNPDDFGSYGYSLNMAYWLDSFHLNATGSNRFADLVVAAFLTGWA